MPTEVIVDSSPLTEEPIQIGDEDLSIVRLPERPPSSQFSGDIKAPSESETYRIQIQRHDAFQETIRYFTEEELLRVEDFPSDLSTSDVLGTFPASIPNLSLGENSDQLSTSSPRAQSINQSLFMLRQFVSLTTAWPSNNQHSSATSLTYDPTNNRFRLEYIQNSRQSSLAGSSGSQFGVFAEQSNSGTSVGIILPLGGQPESTGRLGVFRQQLTSFLDYYKETYADLSPEGRRQLRENALSILDSCVQDLNALASRSQSDQQRDFALALAEQMQETRDQIDVVR